MTEYVQLAQGVDSRISRLIGKPGCDWQRIPRLLTELHKVGVAAQDAEADGRSLLIGRIPQKDCIDPKLFFQDYI